MRFHRAGIMLMVSLAVFVLGCDGGGEDTDMDGGADSGPNVDGGDDAGEGELSIDGERIYDDVAFLADPSMGGRPPGSAGNAAAAEYVASLFEEEGLAPGGDSGSYYQTFDHPIWHEIDTPSLAVDEDVLVEGVDYDFKAYSPPASGTGEIVFVGYGIRIPAFDAASYPSCPFPTGGFDELAGLDLEGAVVVRFSGAPNGDATYAQDCPVESLDEALEAAEILALIEVPDFSPGTQPGFIAGYYVSPSAPPPYPVLLGNRDSFEEFLPDLSSWNDQIDAYTIASAATGIEAAVHLNVETVSEQIPNVIGVLPGTDPALEDEVVLVGAHLDHVPMESGSGIVYQGADDNASGTAVVMELARAAASIPGGPARTLVFAAWNAEETGLAGSCHYVGDPLLPIADTAAVLNFDMVGSGDESGIIVINAQEDQNAGLMDVMTSSAEDDGLSYVIYPYATVNGADHYCFFASGVPAVTILSLGNHSEAHTTADTMDIVTPGNLEVTALVSWATLLSLAAGAEVN